MNIRPGRPVEARVTGSPRRGFGYDVFDTEHNAGRTDRRDGADSPREPARPGQNRGQGPPGRRSRVLDSGLRVRRDNGVHHRPGPAVRAVPGARSFRCGDGHGDLRRLCGRCGGEPADGGPRIRLAWPAPDRGGRGRHQYRRRAHLPRLADRHRAAHRARGIRYQRRPAHRDRDGIPHRTAWLVPAGRAFRTGRVRLDRGQPRRPWVRGAAGGVPGRIRRFAADAALPGGRGTHAGRRDRPGRGARDRGTPGPPAALPPAATANPGGPAPGVLRSRAGRSRRVRVVRAIHLAGPGIYRRDPAPELACPGRVDHVHRVRRGRPGPDRGRPADRCREAARPGSVSPCWPPGWRP